MHLRYRAARVQQAVLYAGNRADPGRRISNSAERLPHGDGSVTPPWYAGVAMELRLVPLETPEGGNIVVGQAHFIKTAEDIYEAIVNTVPQMKFGVAFNEASGPCLTRVEGNDEALEAMAARNAAAIGAGHAFVVVMREGYPVNVLGRIRDTPEVCTIFCATANPVEVVVAETGTGRGVLGVIDGASPRGLETAGDVQARRQFLRTIGYKR